MNKLEKMVSATLAFCLMFCGSALQADNHGDGAKAQPVEFWSCKFNEGKGMDDLEKATKSFNKWARKHDRDYVAWIMTPDTYGPDNTTEVAWLGSWPDGNAWGKSQDAWRDSGEKVAEGFFEAIDCDAHLAATSLAISAPEEPPEDGVVMFSRCEVAEGKTFDDAIAAHRATAGAVGEKSGANSWLFFPGSGSAEEGSASFYWLVLGFDSYTELGAAWEMYTNGGGYQQVMQAMSGVTDCGATTTWHARRATD